MPHYWAFDPVLAGAFDLFGAKMSHYCGRGPGMSDYGKNALVRVMSFAWRWTAAMPWGDRGATEGQMEATNALEDLDHAPLDGIRLELP